jgi:ribosomal protein S18 acetylase RimI-like enzyme
MFEIRPVDFSDADDRANFCELLNHYAMDPMGGGRSIEEFLLSQVCDDLMHWPGAFSFMGFDADVQGRAMGLINCFLTYSTFKAKPIMNIHDIVVREDVRGKGLGQALLFQAQELAQEKGCCKLTLEVLSGNALAIKAYQNFGFENYQLLPEKGHAMFLQKWIW